MGRDPATPEQWQQAVDAARELLVVDAARQLGTASGDPTVRAVRCAEILCEGARRGIRPSPDAIDRVAQELAAGHACAGNGEGNAEGNADKKASRKVAKGRKGSLPRN